MAYGDPESDTLPPDLRGGNPETGRALQKFFLTLLEDKNLRTFHEGRSDYIARQEYLNEEARRLLAEVQDPLREIEKHIFSVTGSGSATPIWVVSPPY